MAADGGCERDVVHRMNEGYRAWEALKSVLSNRGLGLKAKKNAAIFAGTVFFRTALPCSGGYHLARGGKPLHDAVGINCKKGRNY